MTAFSILESCGVTRLCHFTMFKSLTHIITSEDGILASSSIRQDTKTVIDTARYDGELDYVCCSVQYPNSWFLQKAMQNNCDKLFEDWVVLYINPDILNYKKDTKFCPCNASTKFGAYIESDIDNIGSIFADSLPTFKYPRTPRMLASCPTDGQAEILIKDSIPRKFIIGIAVGNMDVAKRVYAMLKMYGIESLPLYIAPDVLTKKWSCMIRKGDVPKESLCDWSKED